MSVYGIELLYELYKARLRSKIDAAIVALHGTLINFEFRTWISDKPSELLPPNWFCEENEFTIPYTRETKKYTLKVLQMSGSMLIHLMEDGSEKVATVTVQLSEVVNDDYQDFNRAYQNLTSFSEKISTQLKSTFNITKPGVSHTTENNRATRDSDRNVFRPSRDPTGSSDPYSAAPANPFEYGRSDLDPFSSGVAGGMMFDPLRQPPRLPGNMPPGAVPPGARYDPYGPDLNTPGGRRPFRPGPDFDEMRPPGWGDDTFM